VSGTERLTLRADRLSFRDRMLSLLDRMLSLRARRLSLRARMLVMLVGVTTILLLIMGTVSTYLLAGRVRAQAAEVDLRLAGSATLLAKDPTLAPNESQTGYSAVEIPLRSPLAVKSLTTGTLTDQLTSAVSQWMRGVDLAQVVALVNQGQLVAARDLLGGCQQFPGAGCKPLVIGPKIEVVSRWVPGGAGPAGRAILFVGQSVSSDTTQVRGFIIAELITGAALIALLVLGGEWLIGRGLEPLDEMTRTAYEITSRGDLTARMPDADDQTEVGKLGTSINTMLDRIQQAFSSRLRSEQKVREFAADASHELRTPLTTIRGYAELYRQGALGPDELPKAMRRIEQEADRMSTLVAELLELARLDRTSSLDLTETDLAGVVRDAVADATAVEPERPVRAEAPPRLVAVVDEPRIRQVLANLLGNVRAHTPVTTPVTVRLGEISGGVLIQVADAGPGMSAQDVSRAFDRFHRAADIVHPAADWPTQPIPVARQDAEDSEQVGGPAGADSSWDINLGFGADAAEDGAPRDDSAYEHGADSSPAGSRRAERTRGSGLGLSIVQAIATAHGGRATMESSPGQGTKIQVWLPVRIVQ
jgi:signal transduction histidine kinase